MQIIIYRGTHQIGGVATEIKTESSRILIDIGDELSQEDNYVPQQLSIPGITDSEGMCDAVFITHYHGDHIGQLVNVREDIPIYMGCLAKDIMLATAGNNDGLIKRIEKAHTFLPGVKIQIRDIAVTPYSIDHSACDSYMFLIEAENKRILHTGDFRFHGFRGKGVLKLLDIRIGKIDMLITEGTTLSRTEQEMMTEQELQHKVREYMEHYKYVFVLCSTTNLERICALSKTVPYGKYFVCDEYQKKMLDLVEKHWGKHSELFRNIKITTYGENLLAGLKERGFLMVVRDNRYFREIMQHFDGKQSIILYSMWDGYRTKPGSSIPELLETFHNWQPLHTSGHASCKDILTVIEKTKPETIVPIHTEKPELLRELCSCQNVMIVKDGERIFL